MVYMSSDSTIKVLASPRKPFPRDIPQAGYEHFLADGKLKYQLHD